MSTFIGQNRADTSILNKTLVFGPFSLGSVINLNLLQGNVRNRQSLVAGGTQFTRNITNPTSSGRPIAITGSTGNAPGGHFSKLLLHVGAG